MILITEGYLLIVLALLSDIINNGIEKSRISGKGYGKSQLVNSCKNGVQCSEVEHRENRRIELKITGILKPQLIKPRDE